MRILIVESSTSFDFQDNREGLHGRVPYRLSADRRGCVACALEAALEVAAPKEGGVNGVVLLVSASSVASARGDRMKEALAQRFSDLERQVEAAAVPVHHVFFSGSTPVTPAMVRYGSQHRLSSDVEGGTEKRSLLRRLSSAFLGVLSSAGGPRVEQTHRSALAWHGAQLEGTFRVEEELRTNLWVVLTSNFKEDVEAFEITRYGIRQMD